MGTLKFYAALLLAGCTFSAEGMSGTGLGPGQPTTTGLEPDTGSDEDSTGTTPSSATEPTPDPVTGSEESGPPTDAARLVFAPMEIDFGNLAVDEALRRELEVRNVGEAPASFVTSVLIQGPFGLPAGFAGTEGTCGNTLAPGESCTLDVRFSPSVLGPHASALTVEYYDGVDLGQPVVPTPVALGGAGVGETDNLIENPSAADGLTFWDELGSNWEAATDDFVDGPAAFRSGNPAAGDTTLTQDIGLTLWSAPLAAGGVHFRLGASAKVPVDTAVYSVELDFGVGTQTPLQGSSTTWDPVDATGPVPLGATGVQVVLRCQAAVLTECSAMFDALSLSLVYPAP